MILCLLRMFPTDLINDLMESSLMKKVKKCAKASFIECVIWIEKVS